ncbi:Tyrosyl-tRNA synthetase [Candidatus Johnevansia muelleri]|uniref:Tyrosine--tRNA ligase n=1 Tax=Candidatus Johnevansia muelleri TaxID=1495769 RepID=A0A078KDK5_9GAMM|nr:Tyrosyl-tRNA synthetase [Candidatus Evansia muelleri]
MNLNYIIKTIKFGIYSILNEKKLIEKLKLGKKLRIKAGFDPTTSNIHLGHIVLINKLIQFQKLGHEIQIIIGDFTARIGDPTGKNIFRKSLTKEEVNLNSIKFKNNIINIFNNNIKIFFNSKWMDKLSASKLIDLSSNFSVARMLERDNFYKRYKSKYYISIQEFMYPIIQGYDSVILKSDIEIGGSDQIFNLLMGRNIQKKMFQDPQIIITMPILIGIDGYKKMSKSLYNSININDNPGKIFQKIISIPDHLILKYLELLSLRPIIEIKYMIKQIIKGYNPQIIKKILAKEIIKRFYGNDIAQNAHKLIGNIFNNGNLPINIPKIELYIDNIIIPLASVLNISKLVKNSAQAKDLLLNKRVKVNGNIVDIRYNLKLGNYYIQAGKKNFAHIFIKNKKLINIGEK